MTTRSACPACWPMSARPCTVLMDGVATRSCITPVADVAGKKITTIEAIDAAVVHPQADQPQAAPQQQAEDEVHPEEHGAVHHVEDLEADEERSDHDEDGGRIGFGHEAREERL